MDPIHIGFEFQRQITLRDGRAMTMWLRRADDKPGLAGQLLDALAEIARRRGIGRFTAEVLTGNAAMLSVFRLYGLPLRQRRSSETFELTMGLDSGAS